VRDALSSLARVAVLFPILLVVSYAATRLLGVRRSWLATSISVGVGIVVGGGIAYVVVGNDVDAPGFWRTTFVLSFICTMLAVVVADLLARPGTLAKGDEAGLFVLPRPVRDVREAIDEWRRFREILGIISANGFGPAIGLRSRRRKREAVERLPTEVRLRRTLEECGGMFVKLGQVASTRSDVLPPNVIETLSQLQSQVAPEPVEVMQASVEQELGRGVDEVFAEFEWDPIAAASIGQVYRATLRTGEPVIVKVQRPRVADLVERDSRVLLRLAATAEANTPLGAEYRVRELAKAFSDSLHEELDFRIEAHNTVEIAANMVDQPLVTVPKIYDEHSTPRLLVQERLVGVGIDRNDELAAQGVDRAALADALLRAVLKQMMTDGFFHADLHPGTLMVLGDGTIGMIDFGATGRLDALLQSSLRQMLMAVSVGDASMLRQAVAEVMEIDRDVDPDALERALARFMGTHIGGGGGINASAISDLMQLLTQFGIQVPPELTTFSRALVILEGTLTTLAPGYKMSEHAQEIGEEWVAARVDEAGGSMEDLARDELIKQLPTLRQLPRRADRIGEMLERGTLSTRVSVFSNPADVAVVTKLVNRLTLGFVSTMLGLISVLLIRTDTDVVTIGNELQLLHVAGGLGLVTSAVLMLRVVASIIRDGYS
jgi:ubiquinone biosynthesis protein